MTTFRAYLSSDCRTGHPTTLLRRTPGLQNRCRSPAVVSRASAGCAQPAASGPGAGHRSPSAAWPPAWQQWAARWLYAAASELCFAANVADQLMHPLASLRANGICQYLRHDAQRWFPC